MFKIAKRDVADVNPHIYLEGKTEETIVLGEALKLASGKLTKAGASDEVTHICMGVANDEGLIPVMAVHPTDYFETTSTATVAPTAVGTAVTLHTDGLTVTATAGGPFVIDETDGATTNSTVIGHFVKPAAGE